MSFGVLKWQRAVIDACVDQRPGCHSSVCALVPVLVKHANRHGHNVCPTQATMSREAGLHSSTVKRALEWLQEQGFLIHVRNLDRGRHLYSLQFPDTSASEIPHPRQTDSFRIRDELQPVRASDRASDRGSKTTNGVNGVTPLEDVTEERVSRNVICSNCEEIGTHDPDCPHRPFEDTPEVGTKLEELVRRVG